MSVSRSGRRWYLLFVLVFALPLAAEVVKVEQGISLDLPADWMVLPREFRNVVEVVPRGPGKNGGSPLRVLIAVEKRRSHDESIRRLGEIAAEWKGTLDVTLVQGWPAIVRRYDFPLPRRGQSNGEDRQISPSLTMAVAYGARVIRMEVHLMPGEERALLDRAAKLPSALRLAESGKLRDTTGLRSRIEQGAPPRVKTRKNGSASKPAGGSPAIAAPGAAGLVRPENLGELEVAVSPDGRNVVIATNNGFSFSNDSGETFDDGGQTPSPDCCNLSDPSVTWGRSGTFYYAFIGLPNGTDAWDGDRGCSTAIATSTNDGRDFNWISNAVLCSPGGAGTCFPDQEHIAADRRNSAPGGDQVYSVWRHFRAEGTVAACDLRFPSATVVASIVCSQNGAAGWTDRISVDVAGDFPRVTVGGDGFVYVTYQAGANIMLSKFSSCASGLEVQPGFPLAVRGFDAVVCPVPGLDRCDNGNSLNSQTVTVDSADPNHLFLAFAQRNGADSEDVVVVDSIDGGATWTREAVANEPVAGRRFMPWVCSIGDSAFVGWYDRRASAGAARPDLTEYFVGEVKVRAGLLERGTERNLSGGRADPQCAPGFPCGARGANDAQGCPGGPFRLGLCAEFGVVSTTPCTLGPGFSGCPGIGICVPGDGCPKYGDYNGIACSDNNVYAAWASATAPEGVTTRAEGIDVYAETIVVREPLDRLCARFTNCRRAVEMQPGLLRLLCPNRDCSVLDPLPQNCLVKWKCPGCQPGMLCPPFFEMTFEGITKEDWKIELVDFDGRPVKHQVSSKNGRTVVSFRPDKATFRPGEIGDYALVFRPGPKHVPGKTYDVKTRVEVGNGK